MSKELDRFLEAQESDFVLALSEIGSGRKKGHWMWYIFPQIKGLGHSAISEYYAIENIEEAKEFLKHPILGKRLKEITKVLLHLESSDATSVFGWPDDLKLQSSMTLFTLIDESSDAVFKKAIDKFFKGQLDQKTLDLLKFQS